MSFSNAWKWKVKVKSLGRVRLLATPWTTAYQAPPSMGFSRQEYWSGVPLPSPYEVLLPLRTVLVVVIWKFTSILYFLIEITILSLPRLEDLRLSFTFPSFLSQDRSIISCLFFYFSFLLPLSPLLLSPFASLSLPISFLRTSIIGTVDIISTLTLPPKWNFSSSKADLWRGGVQIDSLTQNN